MSNSKDDSFYLQGGARVAALGLPFVVILLVRTYASNELQIKYFSTLTDVVLLVAVLKIGVDTYLPSCKLEHGAFIVDNRWRLTWIFISLILLIISISLLVLSGSWAVPAGSAVVLNALLVAELFRLRANYIGFYFLKAPVVYVVALVLTFFTGSVLLSDAVLIVIITLIAIQACSILKGVSAEISTKDLFHSSFLSFLVVVFSWKEAVLSRWFFSSESLPEIVFYSRLLLVVTFLFMLRNARVPVLLREFNDKLDREYIVKISRSGRNASVVWSLLVTLFILCFTSIYEPTNVVGALLIALSGVVMVWVGNYAACLVFLRKYVRLVAVYSFSLTSFIVSAFVLTSLMSSVFISFSLATLISQIIFSISIIYSVGKLEGKDFANYQKLK